MAIRKFRSIEEMDGYRWYEPGDPVLFRAIRRVWELGYPATSVRVSRRACTSTKLSPPRTPSRNPGPTRTSLPTSKGSKRS